MDVIIHGMDIPINCTACRFRDYNYDGTVTCARTGNYIRAEINRPDWCPMEERLTGKWIDRYGDTLCSECKTLFKDLEYILDDGYPKFCPNCGAKM